MIKTISQLHPMRKKLATVSSRWAHGDQNGHSQPWLSRDLGRDWAVPSRDWAVIILKMPWLSCDLAVTELWPLLAVTEPWSLGPRAVTTVVTVSSPWPFIFSWDMFKTSRYLTIRRLIGYWNSALGPVSISDKTSYRKILWSLEATRSVVEIIASLWNLTGTSAAVLLMCLSNFRVAGQF